MPRIAGLFRAGSWGGCSDVRVLFHACVCRKLMVKFFCVAICKASAQRKTMHGSRRELHEQDARVKPSKNRGVARGAPPVPRRQRDAARRRRLRTSGSPPARGAGRSGRPARSAHPCWLGGHDVVFRDGADVLKLVSHRDGLVPNKKCRDSGENKSKPPEP